MTKTKTTKASKEASVFGRSGGLACAKKHGKSHMRAIGKRGAEVRWANAKVKKKK